MGKEEKKTYDMEERLLDYSVRIIKKDIVEDTEELIKPDNQKQITPNRFFT